MCYWLLDDPVIALHFQLSLSFYHTALRSLCGAGASRVWTSRAESPDTRYPDGYHRRSAKPENGGNLQLSSKLQQSRTDHLRLAVYRGASPQSQFPGAVAQYYCVWRRFVELSLVLGDILTEYL